MHEIRPVRGLEAAADLWAAERLLVLESVLPEAVSHRLAENVALVAATVRGGWAQPGAYARDVPEEGDRAALGDAGGAYRHVQIDRAGVDRYVPELVGLYYGLRWTLEAITGEPVHTSPWERSSINVKVLLEPGDGQGWHYDTNTLTVLLYLTETTPETGTLVQVGEETHVVVAPAGSALIMDGTTRLHRVPDHPGGLRVTAPLNFYRGEGTPERPAGLDALVYGS